MPLIGGASTVRGNRRASCQDSPRLKDSAHLRLPKFTTSSLSVLAVGWLNSSMALGQFAPATWSGLLRDAAGNGMSGAEVELRLAPSGEKRSALTDPAGRFSFSGLSPGSYGVSVKWREFAFGTNGKDPHR